MTFTIEVVLSGTIEVSAFVLRDQFVKLQPISTYNENFSRDFGINLGKIMKTISK